MSTKVITSNYTITGLSCASCAINAEKTLKKQEGVINASVNFADASVQIEYQDEKIVPKDFREVLKAIGYDILTESE